ncbi:MAG: hypothetical protein CSA07_01320 [Bacteroidia bacterium]|nr:MAG: hypothetical protein CSA07_01320 [Bacteroidia bacterium]
MESARNGGRSPRPLALGTLLAFCLLAAPLRAQEQEPSLHLKGNVDSYHAAGVQNDGRWMASHTRVRGDLRAQGYGATARVIANLEHNPLYGEDLEMNLREAYLDYTAPQWGVRAGRQIIILGVADGLQVLDQLSPTDMREFLTRDYDDVRQGVNAVRLSYFRQWLTLDLIAAPIFQAGRLPTDPRSPWALRPDTKGLPLEVVPGERPKPRVKDSELALRARFNLPGVDFSLVAIRGWEKMPVRQVGLGPKGVRLQLHHPRLYTFGGSVAVPIGQTVLSAEGAYMPRRSMAGSFGLGPQERDNALGLLGLSWYAPRQWFVGVQGMYRHIFGYDSKLAMRRGWESRITLNVSKKLLGETLHLGLNAQYDVGDKGLFSRFSAKYQLLDELHLSAGYDLFVADGGMFARYRDNDEVWARLQYFF